MKDKFTEMINSIAPGLHGFQLFQGQFRDHHFEFEYPAHWVVGYSRLLVPRGGRSLMVQGPWNKGKSYCVELSVEIIPLDVDHPMYTYAEEGLDLQVRRACMAANRVRELGLPESLLRWREILSDRKVEVDGQEAREVTIAIVAPIIYDYHPIPEGYEPKAGERAIERYVAFQRELIVYELRYRGSEDEDEIYVEAYKRMLRTFRVRSIA